MHQNNNETVTPESFWIRFWCAVTYLIYVIVWEFGIIAGASYLVWVLDAKIWVFCAAFLIQRIGHRSIYDWQELWGILPVPTDEY